MYLISKPKLWEFNLNHTRPIILLECPRKALIKLINSRLLAILAKHNVLKGNNFASFPFRSTFEPTNILDNIKYDASFHHNNLWILFQDMFKAYDRVNLGMLIRTLIRLHLLMTFVHLIISIFTFQFNKIFTAHGDTDAYYVLSGIDQGEIISSILWCIYYDPLLCKIQNSSLGYTQSVNWRKDITKQSTVSFSNHVPKHSLIWMTLSE